MNETPRLTPEGHLRLAGVLTLRWGGLATQLAVVTTVGALGTSYPLAGPLAVVGFGALTNLALQAWASRRADVPDSAVAAAILLDVGLLTATLALTGGPLNPFAFLYVVHVATATLTLPARQAWAIVAAAVVAYRALFHLDLGDPHAMHSPGMMALHLEGMWIAFVLTAVFVVLFVGRLRVALEARDRDRQRMEALQERAQRFASLATLAGGAAHELATPLATIAFVATELERALARRGEPELVDDARLVQREVARCRRVLEHMASDAGASFGETSRVVALREVVADALSELEDPRISAELGSDGPVEVPPRGLALALRGLVRNALLASPPEVPVVVRTSVVGDRVRFEVVDRGAGMEPEVAARAGEPFFTTRPTGEGMGLGLFLARTVVERAGGRLDVTSARGAGTTVVVELPKVGGADV